MSQTTVSSSTGGMLEEIEGFIERSTGLRIKNSTGSIEVTQSADKRSLNIQNKEIEAVLARQDQDGRPFLQINLIENRKILLTDQLIGFKPKQTNGLDLKKLPRVVTTPDLLSVLEAIEEALGALNDTRAEADMLKKAYFAIVLGAEHVGFRMDVEREWLTRLVASSRDINL